jgi:hypothetical protein
VLPSPFTAIPKLEATWFWSQPARVPGGHEDRDAFGGRGGPQRCGFVEVADGGSDGFTLAVAEAHDRRRGILLQQVLRSREGTEIRAVVRARGEHHIGIGCRGATPLGIERGFAFIGVGARVGTAGITGEARRMDLREGALGVGRQEGVTEGGDIGIEHVGALEHGDRLTRTTHRRRLVPQRIDVVDGAEIGGYHVELDVALVDEIEV